MPPAGTASRVMEFPGRTAISSVMEMISSCGRTVTRQNADAPHPSAAVAVTVACPGATPVTKPSPDTVRTPVSELSQIRSFTVAFSGCTVAAIRAVPPGVMKAGVS